MPKALFPAQIKKPRIAIVGAGNLASTLAIALAGAKYKIDEIVSRGRAASLRRARRLAGEVGGTAVTLARAKLQAEVIWFCVPDGAITHAAESVSKATDWRGRVALHSSGALTSDELEPLRRWGADAASVHPLMTFVRGSRPSLAGVPFAIEGDRRAARVARAIVVNLGAQPFPIRKARKEAYHTWGMFTSPLFTALLAATERVAGTAGVSRSPARTRMLPILKQSLANYAALGAPSSFSGPIVRGDVETVKKHLSALRAMPEVREVYLALARVALKELPAKNRAALEKLFKS
jgi:predicted short-subunit dehydrogenase-like oxidoreductase (DUF2520 family)